MSPPAADADPPEKLAFAQYEEAAPEEAALLFGHALRGPEMAEAVGQVIGVYTLMEKIGDGGFGTVWRAEQEEPVKREVALKIIKLGMDTLEVMKRFDQERAALELMDHPNIARVLDAGATPEGRPFFVMELVRGVAITSYCQEKELPLEMRLTLFKAVCSAVQHAHQKGIIHRDLKPSNILVSESDDPSVPGLPKVIDFGIAKAITTDKLTAITLVTRQEQMIGTPLYMSPEQAAASEDIDTRSDIYALGVLLYELLTGHPPFDAQTLMARGYDEMRRIIREVEPLRPSTRIRTRDHRLTTGPGATSSRLTLARAAIPSDLDLITLRALEKDRGRRYESASAFSEDIQRFLDHEPVRARAPSLAYLAQRWMRRHRAAAAAVIVSLIAIVGGAMAALWQAARATEAQHVAEDNAVEARRQATDADAATRMLLETVTNFAPFRNGRAFSREDLVSELLKRIEAFTGNPLRKASLLANMADNLSWEDAVRVHEEVLKITTPLLAPDDPQLWQYRFELAQRKVMEDQTRPAGITELREIVKWTVSHLGAGHGLWLRSAHALAHYLMIGREVPEEALKLLTEINQVVDAEPRKYGRARFFYRMDYAQALMGAGEREKALALGRQTLRAALSELGESHFETGRIFDGYAALCQQPGLLKEAAGAAHQAVEIFWRTVDPSHRDAIRSFDRLIWIETELGDTQAVLAAHRDVVQVCQTKLGTAHETTLKYVRKYVDALNAAGRSAEAGDLLSSLSEGPGFDAVSEELLRPQIGMLRRIPDLPRAEKALRLLVDHVTKTRPQDLQRYGDQSNLADVLMKQGKLAEAVPLLEEAVHVLEERGSENEKVTKTHLEQARRRLAEAREGLTKKAG